MIILVKSNRYKTRVSVSVINVNKTQVFTETAGGAMTSVTLRLRPLTVQEVMLTNQELPFSHTACSL